MRSSNSKHTMFTRFGVLGAVVAAIVALGSGCETGGKEGNRCNPLVLQDECHAGLHCRPASCSAAYCCPTDRSSTDPNCNAEGCPDADAGADAGDEGGGDAAEGTDGEVGNDAAEDSKSDVNASDGGDAAGDSGSDANASDGGDAAGDSGSDASVSDGSDSG
jgi:hypothetical protein